MSGAMRLWVAGQMTLAADAVLVAVVGFAAAAGFAGRPPAGGVLNERLLVIVVGLLFFFVPGALAVGFTAVRRSPWFWLAGAIPAVVWVPASPFVFLEAGPSLASLVGLALAAAGLVGAVMVVIGGSLAAVETRASTRPR